MKRIQTFKSFLNERSETAGDVKVLNQFKDELSDLFADYVQGQVNAADLVLQLRQAEIDLRDDLNIDDPDLNMWWRFFKDDTLATTVDDVEKALSLSAEHAEHKRMVEMFKRTMEAGNKIEVNFS